MLLRQHKMSALQVLLAFVGGSAVGKLMVYLLLIWNLKPAYLVDIAFVLSCGCLGIFIARFGWIAAILRMNDVWYSDHEPSQCDQTTNEGK